MSKLSRYEARQRRHMRLRQKLSGTANRPRMSVFASNKHIYVQFVNDDTGVTLVSVSTLSEEFKKSGEKCNVKGAELIGSLAANKAKEVGISSAVFDRGGFAFHGKLKAIAEAARKNGLNI